MTTLEISALILAGEFAIVAWVILFMTMRHQHKRIHEDHAHAGAVMRRLETDEFSRRDALTSLFESTYHLEGEDLAAKVDEYVAREKAFYNAMLSLYLSRDGAKLKQIPEELAKILTPWVEMTPTGMIEASEVSDLENEKAALATELASTKDTLEQLMDEYMAAFKKSQEAEQTAEEAPAPESAQSLEPEAPESSAPEQAESTAEGIEAEDIEFDVQSEQTPEPASQPAAVEPEAPPTPESAREPAVAEADETPDAPSLNEEPIDQADLDAMLEAFGTSDRSPPPKPKSELEAGLENETETQPKTPSIDSEPKPEPEPPEDEEARAREELEGLADLFDEPGTKK